MKPYAMKRKKGKGMINAINNCELYDYCKVIKWVWFDDRNFNKGDKMKDYCKMKKALVKGYYEALYEE